MAKPMARIQALNSHGLKGTALVKCWVGWCIKPLSIRLKFIYEYTNLPSDPLRFTTREPDIADVVKTAKRVLMETVAEVQQDGLLPFCSENPAPPVTYSSFTAFGLAFGHFTPLLSYPSLFSLRRIAYGGKPLT